VEGKTMMGLTLAKDMISKKICKNLTGGKGNEKIKPNDLLP